MDQLSARPDTLNSNAVVLLLLVLSAGIHWLRQMVLYVERLLFVSGPTRAGSIAYRNGSVRCELLLQQRDCLNLDKGTTRQPRHLNC
jgi:hypothetical protein